MPSLCATRSPPPGSYLPGWPAARCRTKPQLLGASLDRRKEAVEGSPGHYQRHSLQAASHPMRYQPSRDTGGRETVVWDEKE
eukprot:scaffold1206_cov388-Prasinococcus_capsulatus_cf.AAC.44